MNIQKQIQSLMEARGRVWNEAKAILDAAEGRDLTRDEQSRFNALDAELDTRDAEIRGLHARAERERQVAELRQDGSFRSALGIESRAPGGVILKPNESFSEARGLVPAEGRDLSMAKRLRGLATGEWRDADAERRALSEGTSSAGGYLVPTILSGQLIDLARAQARVIQAGALTVPMESSTLKMARQTGDPSLTWHTEAASVSDSSLTFDQVTFTAQTLPCLVKLSWELMEDGVNVESIVMNAMAKAIALELDRVSLLGSGTAPEPKGVLFQTGINTTTLGSGNGDDISYDDVSEAIQTLELQNFEATAAILSPRTAGNLRRLKDGNDRYLAPPADVAALKLLPSTQIPTNSTVGTSNSCSEVFVADWSQLMIGIRHQLTIQRLNERFVDTGQFAFMAYIRADVQVAHPKAFSVIEGVL